MFKEILTELDDGLAYNPYAGKVEGVWVEGGVSIDYLEVNFGHLSTAQEMIDSTESAGLKLYFAWLRDQEILS